MTDATVLAGAGIKGGTTWGATDELGYGVAQDPVSVHDREKGVRKKILQSWHTENAPVHTADSLRLACVASLSK